MVVIERFDALVGTWQQSGSSREIKLKRLKET